MEEMRDLISVVSGNFWSSEAMFSNLRSVT